MATDQPGDLARFHRFIGEQLDKQADLTPDEALVLWHETHLDDEDLVADLREALDEIAAGGADVAADDFFREFRRSRGLD